MRRFILRATAIAATLAVAVAPARAARAPVPISNAPEIEAGFHLLYELKFAEARERFTAWGKAHPEDPLGSASVAASYLFEEFYRQGVLTSEFFLDDKRLLGGIAGKPDPTLRAGFNAANQHAQELARRRLKANPQDADALFALAISTGMQANYASLIEKHQLESLRLVKEAEGYAKNLLAVAPDADDANLALGAGNYIIGCLPTYKRFFLHFGGIHGDKARGMQQLKMCATRGHYLRPFAKMLLALAALREKQPDLARTQLRELTAEFPDNPLFAHELAKLQKPATAALRRP